MDCLQQQTDKLLAAEIDTRKLSWC